MNYRKAFESTYYRHSAHTDRQTYIRTDATETIYHAVRVWSVVVALVAERRFRCVIHSG